MKQEKRTKNIWQSAIMGVIIGDALGLPVQFLSMEELSKAPVTGMRGFGTFNLPPGTWSDDSSLTLATLESIQRNDAVVYEDIMENYADWLIDGHFTPYGYAFDQGSTCVRAITNYVKGSDTEHCGITGEYANGNGALMRIMPVCLYAYEKEKAGLWSETDALQCVHKVSALTHNHIRSQMACGIYFFLVRAIIEEEGTLMEKMQKGIDDANVFYRTDVLNLLEWTRYGRIFDLETFALTEEKDIKSSGYVVDSLEAAIWSLITTDSMEKALLKAVNLGADTDTVGAIAGGLAGLHYGYESVPVEWRKVIVKGEEILLMCG